MRLSVIFLSILIGILALLSPVLAQDYVSVHHPTEDIEVRVDPETGFFGIGTHEEGIPLTYGFDHVGSDTLLDRHLLTGFTVFLDTAYWRTELRDEHCMDPYYEGVSDTLDNSLVNRWVIPYREGNFRIEQIFTPTVIAGSPMIEIKWWIFNDVSLYTYGMLKFFVRPADRYAMLNPGLGDANASFASDDVSDLTQWYSCSLDSCLYPNDSLISKCHIGDDFLSYIEIGELETVFGRDYEEGDGYGYPIYSTAGVAMKWGTRVWNPGATRTLRTYYGFGDMDIYTGNHFELPYVNILQDYLDCGLDTVIHVGTRLRNGWYDVDSARFCIDISRVPHFHPVDSLCRWIIDWESRDVEEIYIDIRIPDDYSTTGPHYDSIGVDVITWDVCTGTETIRFDTLYTTRYFDPLSVAINSIDIGFDYVTFHYTLGDTTRAATHMSIETDDFLYSIPSPYHWGRITDSTLTINIRRFQQAYTSGDSFFFEDTVRVCGSILDRYHCFTDTCIDFVMPPDSLLYRIGRGWNLTSRPHTLYSTLFDAFGGRPPYFVYDPEDREYLEMESYTPGRGLWLLSEESADMEADTTRSPRPIYWNLLPGWNIVGGPSFYLPVSEINSDDLISTSIFGFDPVSRSYFVADGLVPGQGYFILSADSLSFKAY